MSESAQQYSDFPSPTNPPVDDVINNLLGALKATVALPANPTIVAIARETLLRVHHIQRAGALANVSDQVAMSFRFHLEDLQSPRRNQRLAFCRQVAMYLCRKITGKSFPVIGDHFNRDHSTVIHACQVIEQRTHRDVAFRRFVDQLEAQIIGMPTLQVAA